MPDLGIQAIPIRVSQKMAIYGKALHITGIIPDNNAKKEAGTAMAE